jgi:class 3 adenylate cyclase
MNRSKPLARFTRSRLAARVVPMSALPSGTVTLFFTDVEGSTRLLRELGERYDAALAEHHRILRDAFDRLGGREVDTQGEAFFATFPRATDAVAVAAEVHRRERAATRISAAMPSRSSSAGHPCSSPRCAT